MSAPFKAGNILIPKNIDMSKWSVVACDQYTSEPNYWKEVEQLVGQSPSSLKVILPEVYLKEKNVDQKIRKINNTMKYYLDNDMFDEYDNSMIYVLRTQEDGRIREGLIGIIDLEDYSYDEGSQTLIRATEKTVIERIPPRVKIRENALIELPHIMILIDDDKKEIIEDLKNKVNDKDIVYDFDLMKKGGHIKGYKLSSNVISDIERKLEILADPNNFTKKYNISNKNTLLFAIGDGNHSLATAKVCYEKLKKKLSKEEYLNHPARYALVELVNLHSDALEFEAIHRVLFNINVDDFINNLYKYYKINENGNGQKINLITKKFNKTIYIENPKSNTSVGSIQIFLDEYMKSHEGKIDYIHGEDVVKKLCSKENSVGIILDAMKKSELFKTVILDGALPRKTFSMGHSYDKRFYLETRKIK